MSYGLRRLLGTMSSSSGHRRDGSSVVAARGGSSQQLDGMKVRKVLMASRQSFSVSATWSARPVTRACISAPPRSSSSTVSPIPPLTSDGPDQPMKPVPRTMSTSSENRASMGGRPKQGPSIAATWGTAPAAAPPPGGAPAPRARRPPKKKRGGGSPPPGEGGGGGGPFSIAIRR